MTQNRRVIELTGGIGAGKSRILRILREEYGALVLQTDAVGRELERKGRDGYRGIVEAFGPEILSEDGEIDAGKLAGKVFGDRQALETVNGIVHPLVWREVQRQAEAFRAGEEPAAGEAFDGVFGVFPDAGACLAAAGRDSNPSRLLVIETALPDRSEKAGDIYDEIWYVYTLEETRIGRLMADRGYSREKCRAVMANQCSEREYRALADWVLDNNGDLESVRRQIAERLGGPESGESRD